MPGLVALAMVAGYLGGTFWGVTVLDIQPQVWFDYSRSWADTADVYWFHRAISDARRSRPVAVSV